MSSTDTPFRMVLYSAGGTPLGETASITQLNNQVSLDRIGSATITIPAIDPIIPSITPGTYMDLYDELEGFVGRFYYKSRSINDGATGANVQISCDDELVGLRRDFVGYRRKYNFVDVATVVQDLLTIVGWAGTVDAGIGSTTVEYEGESVFAAVDVLRDRWKQHYRLGTTAKRLEFGSFGEDSGIILQAYEGQYTPLFEANGGIHISNLRETVDADNIYNTIVATSGGQGSEAELTMSGSSVGTYPVLSGTNQDGTSYYYVQDTASVAAYGKRVRVAKFTGIKPISNNATDIQRARDATKYAADAYLRQNKDPVYTYSFDVDGLKTMPRVGDQVHVIYRSLRGDNASQPYISLDGMFYVMDVRNSRNAQGNRTTSLTVCTTLQRRTSDHDVIVDVMRDIEVLKLHVQPYPYWSENTYLDTIQGWTVPAAREYKIARFKVEIDNSVMSLTKVRIRFKSLPLYTSIYFNGSFPTAIADAFYDVVQSTNYPYTVSMFVNGVDVTATYGGPWGVTNAAFDVTADITDLIKNAVGGLYQDHTIEFKALNRTGDAAVGNPPTINQLNSNGYIECNIRVQGVTQGIVPV